MRIAEFDEFLTYMNRTSMEVPKTKHKKPHTNGKSTASHDARAVLSLLVVAMSFPYTPKFGVYAV
jgi:hypothetical protein